MLRDVLNDLFDLSPIIFGLLVGFAVAMLLLSLVGF